MAAAVTFALAPALVNQDIIDYESAEGAKIFKNSTAALPHEFSASSKDLKVFLSTLSDRAASYGWDDILTIPDQANAAVTRSLLSEYGSIPLQDIVAHATTYIDQDVRNAQNSYTMYQCLVASITKEALARITLHEDSYTIAGIRSGPALLKVIIMQSYLDTNATTKLLRDQLSSLDTYMVKVDSDIKQFNDYVRDKVDSLAARGETTNDLLANLFNGYAQASDHRFVDYMLLKESNYEEGQNFSPEQLMQLARDKYDTLVEKGIWKAPSEERKKIIALEARIDGKLKKLEDTRKGTKTSGNSNDNKSAKKSKDKKQKQSSGQKKKSHPAWTLQAPKDSSNNKKVVDGKTYWWCPKHARWVQHQPGECKLDPDQADTSKANGSSKPTTKDSPELKLSQALAAIVDHDDE